MEILVVDGQGGRIGQQLVRAITARYPQLKVFAVGTNGMATAAMLKGGAAQGATGENALLGEISPAMALAVGQSRAKKILIPINQCDNIVAGVEDLPVSKLLDSALEELDLLLKG